MPGASPAFSRPVTYRRTIAPDLTQVRHSVRSIRDFLAEQGWPENDLDYLGLALIEACNNAIEYADAGSSKPRPITVEASSDAAHLELRIYDHTAGFDWPEKIELPPHDSESGRGLHLITSRMDYAAYFRGRGENILVLRKNRPAGAATSRPPAETEKDKIIGDLVEELSSCYESLSAIFRYSAELGKASSLPDFAGRLLNDLLRIVAADWFVLRTVSKPGQSLVVLAASEPGLRMEALPLTDASPSLELEALRARQAVWFDAKKPPPAGGPIARAKPGCAGLVHPILLGDRLVGTLVIGRQPSASSPFTAAQTNVVNTFADFLAIQIANAQFQEEQINQRLVAHELEIAAGIQRSLLPAVLPQLPGFSLAAFCRSAREVGGDFYDAIKLDESSLLLVIADVMGKGIPAAMFAAVLRSLLRASLELARRPAALLGRVNALLYPELSAVDMFITAQLAFVDAGSRTLAIASAGHCPLALAADGATVSFSPDGMPLGLNADVVFEEAAHTLPKDCRLLIYSDGITEAFNASQAPFGQKRLMAWLAQSAPGIPSEQLKQSLVAELDSHQAGTSIRDDQTFLLLSANT